MIMDFHVSTGFTLDAFQSCFNSQDSKRSLKEPSDCNLKMTVWSGKTILEKKGFLLFCVRLPKCLASFQGLKTEQISATCPHHGAVSAFLCFFFRKGENSPMFSTPMRRVRKNSHGVVLLAMATAMAVVMFSASNFVLLQHTNPRGRRPGPQRNRILHGPYKQRK